VKKIWFVLLGFVLILSFMLGACKTTNPSPSTTSAPATTTQATTTKPTTTAPTTVAPTTTAAPTGEKYGGVFKQALTVGPSRPIGLPAEFAPDSATAAAPALEPLIRVKKGGIILPVLATAWKVADDLSSITLTLRKGVKFHDGSDFNAAVCKWNLDQQIVAKMTTDWKSVDVVDDYTIRINVNSYKNSILTNLASGITQQCSKASFDKNGIEYTRWNPVGTGPFIFVEYQRDAKLTYKRNPNYWDPGLPYLDGLTFTVIADETVRKLAFQKGDIHMILPLGLPAQELQKAGYPMKSESFGTFVLIPDSASANSPWSNVNVRLAASYALNREALANALGFGFAKPAYQIFPGFADSAIPNIIKTEFNQTKAKDLLKQAGYPTGFKTTIHCFVRQVPKDYITAVAAQLREVGIDVTTDFPEAGKYDDLRYKGWNDGLMGHALAVGDNKGANIAMYFQSLMFPSVAKPAGWQAGMDAALGSKEYDPKLVQAVIQIMYDNMMLIPYLEETKAAFYQKGVHDDGADSYSLINFVSQYAWLEKSAR
jgi:peptide/nickel transport system substrate-binding protein